MWFIRQNSNFSSKILTIEVELSAMSTTTMEPLIQQQITLAHRKREFKKKICCINYKGPYTVTPIRKKSIDLYSLK